MVAAQGAFALNLMTVPSRSVGCGASRPRFAVCQAAQDEVCVSLAHVVLAFFFLLKSSSCLNRCEKPHN